MSSPSPSPAEPAPPPADVAPGPEPGGALRYGVLAASILMLLFLGTGQAWSVFIAPLREAFGYSSSQLQFVFTTNTFVFCFVIILGGRLQDRWGPRPLVVISAALMGSGFALASLKGSSYFCLWLGMSVLVSAGSAMGYTCPVATAIRWFPRRAGLVAGLAAAGFGVGPIVLSNVVEVLLRRQWPVLRVFGLVGYVWVPLIFVTGMMLFLPPGRRGGAHALAFKRRHLLRDMRFWTLFAGMFFGTFPYLLVMGSVKPMGAAFGIGAAAAWAITAVAGGNTAGRVFWGVFVDRMGPRVSMLAAQTIMLASLLLMGLAGSLHPAIFLLAAAFIGFCYGSNFAIYPSTVSRLYGARVLGSVYPFIMAAQGIASMGATINGVLRDRTGSYIPGLIMAVALTLAGLCVSVVLTRSLGAPEDKAKA